MKGFSEKSVKKDKFLYVGFVIILSILCGMMYNATTKCCEDLWYTSQSVGIQGTWEYFTSTLNNCIDHWNWDTGRLCNTASAPFLGLFPIWVYAAIITFIIAFIYIIGIKIAEIKYVSVNSALWMFLISFIIPWHDFMFTIVYSINYIWGSALALLIFYLFIKSDQDGKSKIAKCLGLGLLAYITGWWHEGMSFPLLAALIVYQISIRKRPTPYRISLYIGLLLGLATIAAMPAFWLMTDERHSNIIKTVLWETLVHLFVYNCLFYLYAILLIIVCSVTKLRKRIFTDSKTLAYHVSILTFGLISCIVYIKYYNGPRTGMFSQIFCGLGIIGIIKSLGLFNSKIAGYISLTAIFLLASVSLAKSIQIQNKLSKEIDAVNEMAAESERRTGRKIAYYDPTPISFGIDLLKPSYQILNTKYGLQGIELFPTALKNFSLKSKEIKHCSDSSLILYNNRVIYLGVPPEKRIDIRLIDSEGNEVISRTRFRELVTIDGDTVSYVIPHTQAMGSTMKITDAILMQ